MNKYNFNITCTRNYYGPPEARQSFKISNPYLEFTLEYYGCRGFDIPKIIDNHHLCNGYFWSIHKFMNNIEKGELREFLFSLKENETKTIEL